MEATQLATRDEPPVAIPPYVRILIVDDDRQICDYVQTLLERDGYGVKTMTDPTLVEEEVRSHQYHVIILDLMMPKLDGIELLRRIRNIDKEVAVVIFTAHPNLDTAVASVRLEAVDYLKKPFNVDEFREVLARALQKQGLSLTAEEHVHKVIGEAIRRARVERDLTLKQLSRRSGLSLSMLSQIERGCSSPSVASLHRIAIALGAKIGDLVRDT